MKQKLLKITSLFLLLLSVEMIAQTNPAITQWIQNTTEITGRHYEEGNSTPIEDDALANTQSIDYSDDYVYVSATGVPSYITGPFLDGNPSIATDQEAIYKFPLNPTENTGTKTETTAGTIGVFINGVSLYDYRDGVAWDDSAGNVCGGPGNTMCSGGPGTSFDWNRDAIPAENEGFDCAKAHPAMGNYHHHQNPSAFDLDLVVVSDICSTYPADGLYVIDTESHSPLIGFAYDGFPIYGAYAYSSTDGIGSIVRMRSSYELDDSVTTRTNGPDISTTYFNGYFREDYTYNSANTEEYYLDEHNGRFAITPEYPNGTYAYYATVDESHNSTYPYAVGPTFYGNVTASNVTSVSETTTNYDATLSVNDIDTENFGLTVYPNPAQDFIAIQSDLLSKNLKLQLTNGLGQVVLENHILQGSTLSIMDTSTLYNGIYFLKTSNVKNSKTYKIIISK